jgi:hypothetical protein
MTQEEKQLLLVDLCSRLPYVTYYDLSYYGHKTRAVLQEFSASTDPLQSLVRVNTVVGFIPYENIKPYLRPMSSMTEEEKKEFHHVASLQRNYLGDDIFYTHWQMYDWLNAHHFDYRGLITKGLALEAPEGMYNT